MDKPKATTVLHEWESHSVKGLPVRCHQCDKNMMVSFKCKECGFMCHKECLAKIGHRTLSCTKLPYVPPPVEKKDKEKEKEIEKEKKELEKEKKKEKEKEKESGKRSLSGMFSRNKREESLERIDEPAPASPSTPVAPAAKATEPTAPVVKDQHSFDTAHLSRPTYCDLCKAFIWGLAKQAFRCKVCQFTIHKKCLIKVPVTNKCVTDQIELLKKLEELQEQLKRAESTKDVKLESTSELPKVETLEISKPAAPTTGGGAPESDGDDEDMCVICWQNKINTVLLECGHRCVCLDCSSGMDAGGKLCPICRATVARVVRIYDAH